MAQTKTENLLKDENEIAIYDLLVPILESLKEKCDLIISNKLCLSEIKASVDTIIYVSNQVEIDELKIFKEKIAKQYGNEYITNVENNKEKSVNEDLIDIIHPKISKEELIKVRIKQLCQEKNIKSSIIEDSIQSNNLSPNDLNDKANAISKDNVIQKEKENEIELKDEKIDNNSFQVLTQITSEVNAVYCKTKVIRKFYDSLDDPLELKIYIFKKENIIFSSFNCQIGDSIKIKSKVIKEEKAKAKYVDSIASGNAAIFVAHDEYNKNEIIINMGNLPPKSEIIFISNFISPIETSNNKYEFELFRNLPIFKGKDDVIYQNSKIKGEVVIKSNNEIFDIQKEILLKELTILEEKHSSKNPFIYELKYKIENLIPLNSEDLDNDNSDYIQSSKIYFDIKGNEPLAFVQESNKELKEKYYYIQHRIKLDKQKKENNEMVPSIFIFLLDQSGSMNGESIKMASKALMIFFAIFTCWFILSNNWIWSIFKKYD